jgi:hypothetical protein
MDNEIWFCFPEAGSSVCTLAMVYKYKNGSNSIRELSGTLSIDTGLGFDAAALESSVDLPFSDDTLFSDGVGFQDLLAQTSKWTMVEASATEEQLFYLETGRLAYNQTDRITCYVERVSLGNLNTRNEMEIDYGIRKILNTVIPKEAGENIRIQIGTQERDKDPIVWGAIMDMSQVQYKLDLTQPVSGRLLSFRFWNVEGTDLELGGFDFEASPLGEF